MNILFILLLFTGANEICEKISSFQNLIPYIEKTEAEKTFKKIVEEGIYNLRGPKEDGSFEYAYLSMEKPEYLNFSMDLNELPFQWKENAKNIFSIIIKIPKKKNIFWGNEDAYLKEAIVVLDGQEKIIEKNKILKRGERYEYPFNKIYKDFQIILKFEEMEGNKRSSFVEISLIQAGLKDDPKNPNYNLLKSLIELRKTDIGFAYFPDNLNKTLGNCRSSIKRELLLILYLLKGNPAEQMEGTEKLEKLIKELP